MARSGLPLDLTSGERFRRTLGNVRRDALQTCVVAACVEEAASPLFAEDAKAAINDEPLRVPSVPEEAPFDEGSVDVRDESGSDDSSDSRDDSPQAPWVPDAVPAGTSPVPVPARELATVARGAQSRGEEHRSSSTRAAAVSVTAINATEGLPAWLRETTQQIEWLCSRADPSFQTWAVTVPMDPVTLPETELALQLSHFSITLRFRTRSEHSARLVSRHRSHLLAMLEELPGLPSIIDIDLE